MKQYLKLLDDIMCNGVRKSNKRTGVETISLFGYQMRFNLNEGFPLVTTKKTYLKAIISELLWFIEGSTDERRLAEIHYGNNAKNLVNKKTIWTANADAQGKALGYVNTEIVKELGPIYGSQWRSWKGSDGKTYDQLATIIEELKNNPDDRGIILSAWNVAEINKMALRPCHTLFQFYVVDGKLSCMLYQRSGDAFLGIPFNIASYALLTMMIAKVCDLELGDFVHTIGDLHIYTNHIEQVKLQLSRTPHKLPTLIINSDNKDINNFKMNDFELIGYTSDEPIKAEMAV